MDRIYKVNSTSSNFHLVNPVNSVYRLAHRFTSPAATDTLAHKGK